MVCDIRLSVHPFTLLETLVWSMIFTLKFPQKLRISQPCLSWKVIQLLIVVAHIYIYIYIYIYMCRFVTCCPHHSPMHIPLNQHQIVVFSNGVNAESSGLPSERPAVAVLSWAPSRRLWTLMEHSVHLAIRLGSPKKNSSKPTAILMVFDEFKGRKSKKCRL